MIEELRRHPHARAVLGPALAGDPSHAYLFQGPGGAGKRAAARAVAAELLSADAPDQAGARARAIKGVHPDLTWVSPSGAHEILVADVEGPVIGAATRTPFESARRVFVIERVDVLGEEAANRMLKTLEEPPRYVHLILITDRPGEVLPTIRSRCQAVRFEAPSLGEIATTLEAAGLSRSTAAACARLALGDAGQAEALAAEEGSGLRSAAEGFARAAMAAETSGQPWRALVGAVKVRGEAIRSELDGRMAADLELYPKKDQKRVRGEWEERSKRIRRRTETGALDLGLQLITLWYRDLACIGWGATDLVANTDRAQELAEDAGRDPQQLRQAIELVEETRRRFQLNVTEELACEALAYRLESILA